MSKQRYIEINDNENLFGLLSAFGHLLNHFL